jgi:hypothetical protein
MTTTSPNPLGSSAIGRKQLQAMTEVEVPQSARKRL